MEERKSEVRGVELKITGECSLVEEIVEILDQECEIIHVSRVIFHKADDGCHRFLTITGVNFIE
jgi:hypothetical protein